MIYPVAEEVTGLPRPLSLLSHPYGVTLLTEGGVYGVATLSTGRHTFTPLSTALAPLSFAGGMLGRAGERVCVLLPDGALYAADPAMPVSLSGHSEYRWFPLSPIGGYREDALLYRYAAALPPGVTGLTLSPTPGRAVTETVYSAAAPDGTVCYYVRDGAQRIAVDADGERQGGVFTPAAFLCDIAGLLLFATPDGALGLLSTDRPGQAMYLETQSELYIPGETADDFRPLSAPVPLALHAAGEVQTLPLYRLQDGAYTPAGEGPVYRDGDFAVLCALLHADTEGMLPPEDSHRCGHAFAVAAVFPTLGRDTPGMLKATEPGSTVLRTRVLAPAAVTVSVRTDRTPFRPCGRAVTAAADFTGTDFAAFAFATDRHRQTVCREAERGWREKQLAVSSQGFRAPFALVGLSTRYHVTGPCR